MSLIIPPNYVLAAWTLEGAPGTGPFVTTCGYRLGTSGVPYIDVAEDLFAAYAGTIMPITTSDLTLTKCSLTATDGYGGTGAVVYEGSAAGGLPSSSTPIAAAVIASKVSNQLGRKGRGRMFVPGLLYSSSYDSSGDIGADKLVPIQTALNAFYAALNTASGEPSESDSFPVILHTSVLPPSPILSLNAATKIGWIRKRIR